MSWFEDRKAAAAAAARHEDDILEVIRAQESEGDDDAGPGEPGERDALFRQAAEICIQNLGGSTSLLQRRMKIGYGRAARIIDQLHEAGILGTSEGAREGKC
jgi:S-DNA-T family DNA segregation ATPase FtsK/SpoIIIE